MSSVAGGIDAMEAVFDDGSLVADAGLLLAGTVIGSVGFGGSDRRHGASGRLGGARARGPQGVDGGGVDAGGRPLHR